MRKLLVVMAVLAIAIFGFTPYAFADEPLNEIKTTDVVQSDSFTYPANALAVLCNSCGGKWPILAGQFVLNSSYNPPSGFPYTVLEYGPGCSGKLHGINDPRPNLCSQGLLSPQR